MMNEIIEYLDYLIPNPKCELNFNRDYELLIATMLSAQTTDKKVNSVTSILFLKYPSLYHLASADISDIADIIRPIGTFNKKAKNIIIIAQELLKIGGYVPNNRIFLESLPGVGRKTANVVLSNIYNENLIAVDTHVARVSVRLGIASLGDDVLVIEDKLNKMFPKECLGRLHHQLVLFGRYYCKAKNPCCCGCRLSRRCCFKK